MKRISPLSSYFKRILRCFTEVMCHLHLIFFSFHNIYVQHPIDMNESTENDSQITNRKTVFAIVWFLIDIQRIFYFLNFFSFFLTQQNNRKFNSFSFTFLCSDLLTNCCFEFEYFTYFLLQLIFWRNYFLID